MSVFVCVCVCASVGLSEPVRVLFIAKCVRLFIFDRQQFYIEATIEAEMTKSNQN